MAADVRLERNSVAVEGVLVVEGNGLRVGDPVQVIITTGGSTTNLQIGSAQKPARILLKGQRGNAFLHVPGLIRCDEIDAGKVKAGNRDLLDKVADLERRVARLERR